MTKNKKMFQEVQNQMWAFLYLKKNLSQRQLAKNISEDLSKKKTKISMESVQRILKHSSYKALPHIKEILLSYFKDNGFKSEKAVNVYAKANAEKAKHSFELIPCDHVLALSGVWVLQSKEKSKRLLAIKLNDQLQKKGFHYHLGSLQNILCGKIAETKKIVYDGIKEILLEEFFSSEDELIHFLKDAKGQNNDLYKSVDSTSLVEKAKEFLIKHPEWSKRQLAMKMAKDLDQQGYHISHNSLQYALAGKRDKVKKIVEIMLDRYLKNCPAVESEKQRKISKRTSSIGHNLSRIYDMVETTENPTRKTELTQMYLKSRENEIKKLWKKRQSKLDRMYQRRPQSHYSNRDMFAWVG